MQRDSAAMRDSLAADSLRRATERRDSILAARAADSIKAPIASFAMPALADIGSTYQWDRNQLFASGALTLNDLLERIPGLTPFQSGWIASPQTVAYGGEFRTVRVFLDGFELDEQNPRAGMVPDFSTIPLWTLEELRIERTAREIRVHMRTWSVRSTHAATRVDVATGDYETNTYRGYYGKRYSNGAMLQAGAFQYGTQDNVLGDADHLALMARAGWAKRKFSFVATYYTLGVDRAEQLRIAMTPPRPNLRTQDARTTQAHVRLAYGDPSQNGLWAQLGAGSFRFKLTRGDTIIVTPIPGGTVPDSQVFNRDTVRTRPQYLGALGYTAGPLQVNATARARSEDGELFVDNSVRASVSYERLVTSLHAEQRTFDSTLALDATVRFLPLPFLALAGSIGRTSPVSSADKPTSLAMRTELGLKLGRMWLTGGAFIRDTANFVAPVVFDTAFQAAAEGRRTGTYATIRGKFLGDLGVDAVGMRWDQEGFYRPRDQARAQLYLDTQWLSAVPSGNLHILAAATLDYRGRTIFPMAAPALPLEAPVYRTWGLLLEVRILRAVLTYQFRNVFGLQYQQVPGFLMPRQTNFYGIRWDFVN